MNPAVSRVGPASDTMDAAKRILDAPTSQAAVEPRPASPRPEPEATAPNKMAGLLTVYEADGTVRGEYDDVDAYLAELKMAVVTTPDRVGMFVGNLDTLQSLLDSRPDLQEKGDDILRYHRPNTE